MGEPCCVQGRTGMRLSASFSLHGHCGAWPWFHGLCLACLWLCYDMLSRVLNRENMSPCWLYNLIFSKRLAPKTFPLGFCSKFWTTRNLSDWARKCLRPRTLDLGPVTAISLSPVHLSPHPSVILALHPSVHLVSHVIFLVCLRVSCKHKYISSLNFKRLCH